MTKRSYFLLLVATVAGGHVTVGFQSTKEILQKLKPLREKKARFLASPQVESKSKNSSSKLSGYDSEKGYSRSLNVGGPFRRLLGARTLTPGRAYLMEANRMMGSNKARKKRIAKNPGTLILVRNGSSEGCHEFVGWSDPGDLSAKGLREVEHAARLIRESGYELDVVFTSRLKRSIHSGWQLLREIDEGYLPVFKSWRLNTRSYGALEGLSKAEVAETMGEQIVQKWRFDLEAVPPPLSRSDPNFYGNDKKFADLDPEKIPLSESLSDCYARLLPLWENRIKQELEMGHNVLVMGHGASLRGLIKHVQGLSDSDAASLKIPPGSPMIYEFDKKIKPLPPANPSEQENLLASFLEKPGLLQDALKKEDQWRKNVPGYDATIERSNHAMNSLEQSLSKLVAERELETGAELLESKAKSKEVVNGSFGTMKKDLKAPLVKSHPCLAPLPEGAELPPDLELPGRKASTIVMIRHGKTEHNKLGLFTGFQDVPLAVEGIEEAKRAGKLLKKNGFEFDVVYTSWLSRAIVTAWLLLDELDATWLPIIKTWRLNERMYGDLTGKSKKMVARQTSEEQFKKWRRGYRVRPPPVSSFSPEYPGNDRRYVKFLTDVRYSFSESIIRSIERKRPMLVRKFPKTECLRDCMRRTIPYLVHNIIPESVDQGKRVLISSSENAIRGLLMHLCEIPENKISQLNIPNGVPIVYDVKSKTIKLIDEGDGIPPLEKYDFGEAAEYLFASAAAAEEEPQDEQCDISGLSDEAWETLHKIYSKTPMSIPVQGIPDPAYFDEIPSNKTAVY